MSELESSSSATGKLSLLRCFNVWSVVQRAYREGDFGILIPILLILCLKQRRDESLLCLSTVQRSLGSCRWEGFAIWGHSLKADDPVGFTLAFVTANSGCEMGLQGTVPITRKFFFSKGRVILACCTFTDIAEASRSMGM